MPSFIVSSPALSRRQWFRHSSLLAAAGALLPGGNARAATEPAAAMAVTQIVDMSPMQQDISRDFLAGSRAAWQEYNAQEAPRGRGIRHQVIETDGSAASIQSALRTAQADHACVALSGCAGDATAASIAALQQSAASPLPIAAPWLQRQWTDSGNTVFAVFPDYQAQIAHAMKSLAVMGVRQAGVVYATSGHHAALGASIAAAGSAQGLKLQVLPPDRRPAATPALVLFIGGTPELHAFAHRLGVQPGSHCYLIALADVNLQVLTQLGGMPRNVSVVVTQPVPMVSASLPVVRSYRAALGRLYDEPPSQHGLAGYIAARYTAQVLASLGSSPDRASAMAAFRRRSEQEIGGYTVAYRGEKLSGANVTQSMLTSDGRIVG